MRSDAGAFFDDFTGSVTVLHTGANNFVVLTCHLYVPLAELIPTSSPPPGCTISGVGPVLSWLSGGATSYTASSLQQ